MATFEKRVKQLEQVSCSKEEHSYCDVLIIPGGNGVKWTPLCRQKVAEFKLVT